MINSLTGLRGLALLFVLATGLSAIGTLPSEFGSGLDQVGLMIVFALSGYLLAIHHARERFDRYAVGEFLAARAKRLLPLYFLTLAFAAAISGWWSDWPYRVESLATAARAILLIDAPGPLWIVPALAQLYVLFLVVWWAWFRGWPSLFVVALGVLVAAPAALGWMPVPSANAAALCFFAGVGLGLAWESHLEPFLARRPQAVAIVGGLAFVLACINLPAVRLAHGRTLGDSLLASTWFEPLTLLIVLTLVVTAAARPPSLAVLSSAPLRWLGWSFYPVYLLVPVLVALLK
jgi:peptidoglycan/LPS O-acetylase OafA/YrhL